MRGVFLRMTNVLDKINQLSANKREPTIKLYNIVSKIEFYRWWPLIWGVLIAFMLVFVTALVKGDAWQEEAGYELALTLLFCFIIYFIVSWLVLEFISKTKYNKIVKEFQQLMKDENYQDILVWLTTIDPDIERSVAHLVPDIKF